jgi:hypothetical protein
MDNETDEGLMDETMGMHVGYVRVSKRDQNPELQRRELQTAGCERIFEEKISSREEDRPNSVLRTTIAARGMS